MTFEFLVVNFAAVKFVLDFDVEPLVVHFVVVPLPLEGFVVVHFVVQFVVVHFAVLLVVVLLLVLVLLLVALEVCFIHSQGGQLDGISTTGQILCCVLMVPKGLKPSLDKPSRTFRASLAKSG